MTTHRDTALRAFGYGLGFGLLAGLALYWSVSRRPSTGSTVALQDALRVVGDSLRVARAQGEALRQADRERSAAAAALHDSVQRYQRAVAVAAAALERVGPVQVSPLRPDTAVIGIDTAVTMEWVIIQDTAWQVPLPVATYVRRAVAYQEEAQPQLRRLAEALDADRLALREKDARIALLERADALAQRQDSLHRARAAGLEAERDGAFRRGAITALKVVGVVTLGAIGVAKALAIARE